MERVDEHRVDPATPRRRRSGTARSCMIVRLPRLGADDLAALVVLHDRLGRRRDRAGRAARDHVRGDVARRDRGEQALHHVRQRADRSPVGLAEHAQTDEHQRHRQHDRRERHPDRHVEHLRLHDAQRDRADRDAGHDDRQRELASRRSSRVRRLRNVSTSSRQRSASAVRPPATSMPVAGHITQNRTSCARRVGRRPPPRRDGADAVLDEEVRRDDPREHAADHHADVDAQPDEHAGADAEQAVRHADAQVREHDAGDHGRALGGRRSCRR